MSRSNNLVSWIFGRQVSCRALSDVSDIADIIMSTFVVELTLSSNIEDEIISARKAIPGYDPVAASFKPAITLMSITCLGHLKLEDALKRFMEIHFADMDICFDAKKCCPWCRDVTIIPHNWKHLLSNFHSALFDALAKEEFEIDAEFHPDTWMAYCSLAEKVPAMNSVNIPFPLKGKVLGIRLVQVLPARKVILTIDSRTRDPKPEDISNYDTASSYNDKHAHFKLVIAALYKSAASRVN